MPRRPLHRLAPTLLTALALEAVALYLGRGSSLWRSILFPAHFLIAGWALFELWAALRPRGSGGDRRGAERRRAERREARES
jgi:hypothetical protein